MVISNKDLLICGERKVDIDISPFYSLGPTVRSKDITNTRNLRTKQIYWSLFKAK